jgi:superfamily II DNA/RNA helicase
MYNDAREFFPDQKIEVVTITGVDMKFAKGKILIMDEADAMIDEHKIHFPEEMKSSFDISGTVAAAKADKLVLLSATYEPHHKEFMTHVLGVKTARMYTFKGAA